ncbi:hypothetical protein [Flavobacterium cucumis]|uniref:hypothetical protein n=1 Tax=Flavobacterium cucumis TaxID=416016 RepID=UPI001356424B|nr:hypothetical protein [Flavobacterium cucumis]
MGVFKIWNADDTGLLWQNADGDGFAKAKADGDGFFGTQIREILIEEESLKFGTRMTRI